MVTYASPKSSEDKILQAATRALLHGGEGALRVDQVAADAGINKRMIYHHFGDRAGLIDAVIASQLHLLLNPQSGLSRTSREVLSGFAVGFKASVLVENDPLQEQLDNHGLMSAARIVLAHFLVHATSPDLTHVDKAHWQQFAFEILSCAYADALADLLPDQPVSTKPRYRVTSSSRLKE